MKREQCPLLSALEARGSIALTGAPLSSIIVEVRSERLTITGVTPLRDDGDRYTESGSEYFYELEGVEAEKLLAALCRHSRDRPEVTIAREFEFSRPRCPLKDYLDDLRLTYQYHFAKGEAL